MRRPLSLVAVAAAAALAALVMGEYELSLGTALAMGVVLGGGLPELVLGISRWRGVVPAVATAALGGASVGWAGWISSGQGVAPFRSTVWAGVAVAMMLSAARLRPKGDRQRPD